MRQSDQICVLRKALQPASALNALRCADATTESCITAHRLQRPVRRPPERIAVH